MGEEAPPLRQRPPRKAVKIDMDEKQLKEMRKYLDEAIYFLPEDVLTNDTSRTAKLAQPKPHVVKSLHEEKYDVLTPKERAERIKRIARAEQYITTEDLEHLISQQRQREEARREANKKNKERIFQNVLSKLEDQCRKQIMGDTIHKFANYMSEKCSHFDNSSMMTESIQTLTRGLIFNMYLALGIHKRQNEVDQSLYEKIATVLSNMITEALYSAQAGIVSKSSQKKPKETVTENIPNEQFLRAQAKQATKKIRQREKECNSARLEEELLEKIINLMNSPC